MVSFKHELAKKNGFVSITEGVYSAAILGLGEGIDLLGIIILV